MFYIHCEDMVVNICASFVDRRAACSQNEVDGQNILRGCRSYGRLRRRWSVHSSQGNCSPQAKLPGRGIGPEEDISHPFEAEYPTGADMLIRKSVTDKIGYFDERFTTYCEETDFCCRTWHHTPYRLYFVRGGEDRKRRGREVPGTSAIHSFPGKNEYEARIWSTGVLPRNCLLAFNGVSLGCFQCSLLPLA